MSDEQKKRSIHIYTVQASGLPTDESEALAAGRLLRGAGADERLVATSDAGWWIEGRGGADSIAGAGGDDLLVARRATLRDAVTDGDPDIDDAYGVVTDRPMGGRGCILDGGGGNDLVIGGNGADVLRGGNGDDTLLGFEGNDIVRGGAGDDLLLPGQGAATVEGGAGIDTLSWSDLPGSSGPGRLAGVVLNLSDRLIRYESGDRLGEARILLADAAGGFTPLGEADTAPPRSTPRPEGAVELDIDAGSAVVGIALLLPAVQKVREAAARLTIERFEGTEGSTDVAVLPEGFAQAGMSPDGFQHWSDGTTTLALRAFEVVLIA